jgi:plastocyanin
MNDQRMSRNVYPYSPMAPQPAYRQMLPYAYQTAPAGTSMRMAPPYYRPMAVQQAGPGMIGKPATPASALTAAEQTSRVAVASDSEPAGETVTVRINGMRFEPANITIKPGTRVTWVQADGMPHIISGKASGMRSNTLYSGQNFSYIFQKPGEYDYVCDLHPSMKGSVVVEEAGTGT